MKKYLYFDESGSPKVLGRRGKSLIESTGSVFIVGFIQTSNPRKISEKLNELRKELMEDEYLKDVPSIKSLSNGFHANKDCQEVKEKVFKLLKKSDFEAYIIVARKIESVFRKKFNMSDKKLYKFLVSEILKGRIKQGETDIYFSEMGNIISVRNMTEALDMAAVKGKEICSENEIRIFVQQPSEQPLLQAIDYILWTVFRAYEKGEFRYFDFMKDKIKLVHDVFDPSGSFYGTFYTEENILEEKKISPCQARFPKKRTA